MASLLSELKRRHVDRVVIAYAVAGWVIAQVTELVAQTFEWPAWVMRATVIALVVGLPIAVIVSWTYEITPLGVKRDDEVAAAAPSRRLGGRRLDFAIIGLLVIALAFALAARLGKDNATRSPELDRSVAVLPFLNLSGDEGKEYLSEGISDSLIHALVQASGLKVIARTSSFQFRGKDLDVRDIGQKLGVGAVLEGSVQQSGDKLRVIAQLINTHDGTHYWSKTFDRPATDIFAIQDEIASEVLAALKVSLLGDQATRVADLGTTNLEAYDEFLQARLLFARRISLGEAVRRYQRAVELDPKFVLAWVGLSDALFVWSLYDGAVDPNTTGPSARDAVQHALALDPDCGEAYAALAVLESDAGRSEAAEAAIRKSIELSPGYAHAYFRYHELLRNSGRYAEAEKMIRRAIELDPYSALNYGDLGLVIAFQGGRIPEALAAMRRALKVDPSAPAAYTGLGGFKALRLGDIDGAVRLLRKAQELDPQNASIEGWLFNMCLDLDDLAGAEQLLDDAEKRWPPELFSSERMELLAVRNDLAGAAAVGRRILAKEPGKLEALELVVTDDQRQHRVTPEVAPALADWSAFLAAPQAVSYETLEQSLQLATIFTAIGDARAQTLIKQILAVLSTPARGPDPGWTGVKVRVLAGDQPGALAELRRKIDAGYRRGWQDLRGPMFATFAADAAVQAQLARLSADAARMRESLRAHPQFTAGDMQAELAQLD